MTKFIKVETEKYGHQFFETEVFFAYQDDKEMFDDDYNPFPDGSGAGHEQEARVRLIESNGISVPDAWIDIVLQSPKWEIVNMSIWPLDRKKP